jgi:DNA-binding MarR family transcriptional regulator
LVIMAFDATSEPEAVTRMADWSLVVAAYVWPAEVLLSPLIVVAPVAEEDVVLPPEAPPGAPPSAPPGAPLGGAPPGPPLTAALAAAVEAAVVAADAVAAPPELVHAPKTIATATSRRAAPGRKWGLERGSLCAVVIDPVIAGLRFRSAARVHPGRTPSIADWRKGPFSSVTPPSRVAEERVDAARRRDGRSGWVYDAPSNGTIRSVGVSRLALKPTERRVLRAYLRAVALAEPLQSELAARHGLSLGDLHAVRMLARLGDVPVSRYGSELGVPRSTITNLVDRLERAELVERVASPTDRRVTLVRLSSAGRTVVDDTGLLLDSDLARRLFVLEPESQAALAELLERVVTPPPDLRPSDGTEVPE